MEWKLICYVHHALCQPSPEKKGATDFVGSVAEKGLPAAGSWQLTASCRLIEGEKEEDGEMFHHHRQVLPLDGVDQLPPCRGQRGI